MKKESGKGMIKALLLFIIVVAVIVWICMSIGNNIKTQKDDNIVSNMMLIKGKCKVFNENRIRNNQEESTLIGTKLSEITKTEENQEGENQEEKSSDSIDEKIKVIIEEFKNTQAISEEEYGKYYVLTDANLEELKVDVKNEANSYYLINYETNEVIITKGYEGKYKLGEIEEVRANIENKEEKQENNDDNQEENKENNEEENKEE